MLRNSFLAHPKFAPVTRRDFFRDCLSKTFVVSMRTVKNRSCKLSCVSLRKIRQESFMSYDRFWDDWDLEGIAYCIAASKDGCTGGYYGYNVSLATDAFERRREMRVHRLKRAAKGKKLRELPRDTLQDDLVVLFGPDVSPNEAIASLSLDIERIRKNVLMVGRDFQDNDVKETIDGELQVC